MVHINMIQTMLLMSNAGPVSLWFGLDEEPCLLPLNMTANSFIQCVNKEVVFLREPKFTE